jgi:hypothetical protein
MSFNVTTTIHPEYLRITSTGEFSVPGLFEFIDRVNSEAAASERKRVLVDSRAITGGLSDADRFLGGKRSAEVFGSRLKVAVMFPAEKITKMAELAASNRGAKLLIASSEDEALAWLLKN